MGNTWMDRAQAVLHVLLSSLAHDLSHFLQMYSLFPVFVFLKYRTWMVWPQHCSHQLPIYVAITLLFNKLVTTWHFINIYRLLSSETFLYRISVIDGNLMNFVFETGLDLGFYAIILLVLLFLITCFLVERAEFIRAVCPCRNADWHNWSD